jgi:predicted nucleotidyltransferase
MTLFQVLRTKNARKLFGVRELKIIEKQLFGVALTQSEKNRLSRDIRRKLSCIAELCPFKSQFALKKGEEIQRLIRETVDSILTDEKQQSIQHILLFGSAIENKLTLLSDIDIAVVFDSINSKEATLFRKRVSGKVSSRVDIQVFNVLPKKVQEEITKKHRILYDKNTR